jgi:ribonuclease HII
MTSELRPAGRVRPSLSFEQALWQKGIGAVAGIDEAGRGPLAGPVVAAAVIVRPGFFLREVNDSKKLTAESRARLHDLIRAGAASVGVGIADHEEIDRVNILNATYEAMHRAVNSLPLTPEYLLIDGNRFRGGEIPFSVIVDGDEHCFSIAAASIIAKVTRDRIMEEYDTHFPGYGFSRHKGYGTIQHRQAIARLGLCPIHRRSFTRSLIGSPAESLAE